MTVLRWQITKIALRPGAIRIPKLGWVRLTESLRFSGDVKTHWWCLVSQTIGLSR